MMQGFPSLRPAWLAAGLLLLALGAPLAHAGVVIDGTRVIYPAKEREVTVRLTNQGKQPVLMQVWADRGDERSTPQTANAPFLITPPIFRLDPQKGQSVRLMFTGEKLPQDRESLFWFNSLEVPPIPAGADSNYMQIAVRSRLKLFYRPAGLPGDLDGAVGQVRWQLVRQGAGYALRGDNPSPYHLSYSGLTLAQGGRDYTAAGGMIAPFASQTFALDGFAGGAGAGQVRYRWMSDYGVAPERTANLH